jgi:alpha 1,2-mannosyltransferase
LKPVFVYLAQNTPCDTQYGRDSRSLLEKSLDLFYQNYNDRFGQDIVIFHEGDFSAKDQDDVRKGRREINFLKTEFNIPDILPRHEVPEIWEDGRGTTFGMGHRHMIRFYGLQIFDIIDEMGYDWFARLDDESFIHSPIDYDLFDFMQRCGYEYAYRVDILDAKSRTRGYDNVVKGYVQAEKIRPCFWNRTRVSVGRKALVKSEALWRWGKDKLFGKSILPPTPISCYERWCYYNNFFITKLSFWKSPQVQSFLHYMDRVGGAYKYNWSDLVFQSTAVQLFMPREKVFKFCDFTYEHASVIEGRLFWGGIYPGKGEKNSAPVREFRKLYKTIKHPASWS